MGKYRILLKAAFKKQRATLAGIFIFMFIISLSGFTSVILSSNGRSCLSAEIDRLGFGSFTAWVNGNEAGLEAELEQLPQVGHVGVQPLIFAGYEINGSYSDNEGQIIAYDGEVPYNFISDSGSRIDVAEIEDDTIYVSPALRTSFGLEAGDTVRFELARSNGFRSFTVAGYFEDAFAGSSMIDMKCFLISPSDFAGISEALTQRSENDQLAKKGAMLHVFQSADSSLSESEFQRSVYSGSGLSLYTEFSYSRSSILSYMLLLQNILTGFLFAFSAVLLVICIIVTCHSISAVIEESRLDMAVLKTVGLTGGTIRRIFPVLYGTTMLAGLLTGVAPALLTSSLLARGMVSSTGLLISCRLPFGFAAAVILLMSAVLALFLYLRTGKILSVSPVQAIRESGGNKKTNSSIRKGSLLFDLALREILCGKRRYAGILLISLLLVMFLSIIGKTGEWTGMNGEGLMNAFSVADHDLGVQPFSSEVPMDEIERVISWYSPIVEVYELAMQSVTVDGQEYTANILNDTARFHVLSGSVCDGDSILITGNVANELGISIGDSVRVAANGRVEAYTVSGIYACANETGGNIGMSLAGYSKIGDITGFIHCYHYILEDGGMSEYTMRYLQENYRGIDVHTNSWSGLGGIVALIHIMLAAVYIVAAVFILITVSLTSERLLQSESSAMAVYKSAGISSSRLRLSFSLRFLITVAAGASAGALLASFTADPLILAIFRSFGIGDFNSGFGFTGTFLPPIAVSALFFTFSWLVSDKIGRISLVKFISENDD